MYQSDLNHENKTLHDKLQSLYGLCRGKRMALGFREPYLNLLKDLGNPHKNLPPTIHVAGTNGKGSTIAFMKAILEAAGYSVHTYTSPHLYRFNERIVLNGTPIDDDMLESLIDESLRLNNNADITFFEITTAIAFKAFADHPADVLLLETGMGGRLDCTNVIDAPIATLITPVSYDHMEFLGDTVQDIASEKAGILKHNTPCIIAEQPYAETLDVFKIHAETLNAPLIHVNNTYNSEHFDVIFQNQRYSYKHPKIKGLHQIRNASSAIAALKTLFACSDDVIETGIQTMIWPGRMENVTDRFDIGKPWTVYYDGGHNAAAGQAIAETIQNWDNTHIVLGMIKGKDAQGFIAPILPHARSVTAITIPDEPNAMRAHDIADILECDTAIHIAEAIQNITRNNNGGTILICGSLYLAQHLSSIGNA